MEETVKDMDILNVNGKDLYAKGCDTNVLILGSPQGIWQTYGEMDKLIEKDTQIFRMIL